MSTLSAADGSQARLRPASWARSASPVAWVPRQELDAKEWATAGRRIGTVGRCVQWLLGDWIAYGNEKFGERYARASKITGYDTQTLMNMVYVASRFPISRRRENLSWSHHETLAALEVDEQDRWLDEAVGRRWSVSDLRMMLRLARKQSRADQEPDEDDQAPVDPPSAVVKCPRCGVEIPVE